MGRVTQLFSDPEEGLLTFYAGAFKYHDEFRRWFSYEPLDEVILEYAPYGSDNFSYFNIEEDTEKLCLPGYGAYYFGSLKQVDRKSETGWYDVRISIKNSQGNTQIQSVSPAFFIDSMTGTEIVSSDNRVRVKGRNIIAPEGSIVCNATGVQTGTRNLASGMYLVRAGVLTFKCVVN